MRVDVLRPQLPDVGELAPDEERRRDRQPVAERLANAEDVGQVRRGPHDADPAEAAVDRVDDEQRAGGVAAAPQRLEERRGRHAGAAPPLHGLDDHRGRVGGQRAGVLPEGPPVNGARQPRRERSAEALESRRRQGQQPGAVIRAVEGDDPGPAGGEQRRAEGDLDGVLARDAEPRRPRQRLPQPHRRLRLGEVAERVRDGRPRERLGDARVAVAERGDAEAAREVEVLAALRVPDPAALGARPDHAPSRRGMNRLIVSAAM